MDEESHCPGDKLGAITRRQTSNSQPMRFPEKIYFHTPRLDAGAFCLRQKKDLTKRNAMKGLWIEKPLLQQVQSKFSE